MGTTEQRTTGRGGISVDGVTRSFGTVQAVRGMTFEAPPGAVTALIGPNGSGKTTLLLMLASLLAPDSGSIRIGGADPLQDPVAVRRSVGWMPDTLGVWDSLTATEILVTMGKLYGMVPDAAAQRAGELLAEVRLSDFADKPARVFSRGQQQRLSLARALIHDPAVLLLDEPASGLDPGSRVELRLLLRRLAAAGKTILVSSHVLSELDEMADRAVFVSGGQTVKTQSLDDVGTQLRWYAVSARDTGALLRALEAQGLAAAVGEGTRRSHVRVQLGGEEQAAEVLRYLVESGVGVYAFAPASGALEETYMSLEGEKP
ncbi:ABC transporter ATP-binding protein [Arthrobacter koreensis]|uniref:ABC transporter ATP-binding protein n=1 Tax=Arthrobacter koreensis TaxID=199136 RepID=UPI000B11A642|nr:ABC transporter ATP-binding protein [Arthrobacter koreensis]